MKKYLLLASFALFCFVNAEAQVSTVPEQPRNYKPQPKQLLPMPDSLTNEDIFPVLGQYDITGKNGEKTEMIITKDDENKGMIWVSGLPEGKFKARLKASPAVYMIPSQKTLKNDSLFAAADIEDALEVSSATEIPVKLSGKSVEEGTLIFDKESGEIFINFGTKFNAEHPASVFPELNTDTLQTAPAPAVSNKKKKPKTRKQVFYSGFKISGEGARTDE